jgi:hypothetical protein
MRVGDKSWTLVVYGTIGAVIWVNINIEEIIKHDYCHWGSYQVDSCMLKALALVFGVYLITILEWSTMTNLLILLLPWQTVYWRLWEWTVTLGALIVLMVMIKDLCLWLHWDYQESNHQSLLRKGCWMWQEIDNHQDGGGAGYDIEPFIIWNWSDISNRKGGQSKRVCSERERDTQREDLKDGARNGSFLVQGTYLQ